MHISKGGVDNTLRWGVIMRFTLGQLRETVGLSKEALRHWKRVLPGFPHGQSHAPSFSAGDVLAFAVLRCLTQSCGVQVGKLRAVSKSVFIVCNDTPWQELARRVIVVDLTKQECATTPLAGPELGDSAVLVCPMAPVIAMLREALFGTLGPPVSMKAHGRAGSFGVKADGRA